MAMTGMVYPVFVFELENPCQCEGCCRKISKVIGRQEGVSEFRFEKNRLILKGMNIDPNLVIRRLYEVRKNVRFIGTAVPNHQLHPPPPADQLPACTADHHCQPPPMPHQQAHACCTNEPPPPTPSCHCLCHGAPQGQVHVHLNEPPPSSAFHCAPPPHQCNHVNVLPGHQVVNDAPVAELEDFMHGGSSPLIPRNVAPAELLGQLGNMKNLKQVEFINKKGIKLTFDDGRVTSWHPTYSVDIRPGFERDPQYLPPRYVSPFSDEDPNAFCSIM